MRMRKGIIVHVSINTLPGVVPMKCAYRMLGWTHGTFELEPADENPVPGEIELQVHELLMEGLRQMDEYNHLRGQLPDPAVRLVVPQPLLPPLRDLTPAELDVFQVVHNDAVFGTILNKCAASDLDTARAILRLLSGGYLKTA